MSDCCKIIRLLKEVKRKADSSFAEINHKISRLESRYNILLKQNDTLKSQLEESRIKLQELDKPRPMEEQSQKKEKTEKSVEEKVDVAEETTSVIAEDGQDPPQVDEQQANGQEESQTNSEKELKFCCF